MFDFQGETFGSDDSCYVESAPARSSDYQIPLPKLLFDRGVAVILLVPLAVITLGLITLNPFLNAGPLLFLQTRMGRNCQPFTAIKFRTMTRAARVERGAFDALETDRITGLGRLLRKARIDELPQIINVLRGEMSLIGPRPDCYDHAQVYVREVPGYAERHKVMPGISGFAQTEVGYVDGRDGVRRKVAADRHYIARATFRFDMWIAWRTIVVVLTRQGS